METPLSLASGTGGKLLGTERLSVLPTLIQAGHGSAGQVFATEVERAVERARGDGLQKKRLEELEGERREARRAGFGGERPNQGEARAVEAPFRAEDAPVSVQPAAPQPPETEPFQAGQENASAPCSPCAGSRPEAPVDSALEIDAVAPSPAATETVVQGTVPRSTPELPALPGAPKNEIRPGELPQLTRSGTRAAKPASAPPTATGPDPAVLERAAEILRQIQLHATQGVRRLTLELEPAELGRLSVQLALRAGKVAAIVRGENPETLELLQQREADLLQVLAQRGVAADSVRFELGFGGSRSKRGTRAPAATAAAPPVPASSIPSTAPRKRATLIDLYA